MSKMERFATIVNSITIVDRFSVLDVIWVPATPLDVFYVTFLKVVVSRDLLTVIFLTVIKHLSFDLVLLASRQTQDVNLTYIRRLEDVLEVF